MILYNYNCNQCGEFLLGMQSRILPGRSLARHAARLPKE